MKSLIITKKYYNSKLVKGFTLIELIVTIAIISVLSGIILFTTTQYINKGKDSNIAGNLAVLIPAGESYYNKGNTYENFCNPFVSDIFKNTISEMPLKNSGASCQSSSITETTNPAGVCCSVSSNGQAWAACSDEFSKNDKAWCVDSRGYKKEINKTSCVNTITECP